MKKLNFIYILLVVFGMTSCEFPDNTDPKGASEVPAQALFLNGQLAWVNQVNTINVNWNITRLFAQYTAQVIYVDEGNFNLIDRRIPDAYYTRFYRNALMDLREAKKIIWKDKVTSETITNNKLGMITVMEVYTYQCLVDAFGNVPFTQALMGLDNPSPAYDDAQTIYTSILDSLNQAIASFNDSEPGFKEDFLFHGNIASWRIFANSLKLRIGMRIADVPSLATLAQQTIEEAAADSLISDISENVSYVYLGVTPYTNSIYTEMVEGGRNDYVPARALVDFMNNYNDPRMPLYFTQVDTSTEDGVVKLAYIGGVPGDQGNSYQGCSHFADYMFDPKFPVTIMSYSEVEFLLAEAAQRGFNVGADNAETHYNNAITASIAEWGGDPGDAADFIDQNGVRYDAANWKRSIGLQKWVSLYNQGIEGWAEIRLLNIDDWTTGPLEMPAESLLEENIKRMPYPYVEDDINKANKDAAAAIMGNDSPLQRIFWDVE